MRLADALCVLVMGTASFGLADPKPSCQQRCLPPLPKEFYEKYMKPQSAEFLFDADKIWAFLNRDTDVEVDTRSTPRPLQLVGKLVRSDLLASKKRYHFKWNVMGAKTAGFLNVLKKEQSALPYPTRMIVAEVTVEDGFKTEKCGNPWKTVDNVCESDFTMNEAERVKHRRVSVLFSDANDGDDVYVRDWHETLLVNTPVAKDQVVRVKLHMLDPVEAAKAIRRDTHHVPKVSSIPLSSRQLLYSSPLSTKAFNPSGEVSENNVVFVTKGSGRVYANEEFLVSKSGYFKSLFESFKGTYEDGRKVVNVDFSTIVMHNVLQYLYTNKVEMTPDHAEYASLLPASRFFSIDFLGVYAMIELTRHYYDAGRHLNVDQITKSQPFQQNLQRFVQLANSELKGNHLSLTERLEMRSVVVMDSMRRGVRDVALIVMGVIVGLAVLAIASPFVFLLYLLSFVLFGDLSFAHTVLLAPLKARCC
jgi:hypothetical protein